MRSFSAVENRRLVAFADTSVGFTIRFIIVASWLALDTELRGGRCLSYVGREGDSTITYSQMHDGTAVEQHPELAWFDNRPKATPRAQWVVSSLRVIDTIANTESITQYKYKNPRYAADDGGRYGFRGFEEVMTTNPSGSRTIQRYGYNVDWSGRLIETVVMPSVAEAPNDARTIDKTSWQTASLFGGAIKTYHPLLSEHYVCSNGQTETACKATPSAYNRTTSTLTSYPLLQTAQLWVESKSLLQAGSAPANGDRQTLSTYALVSSSGKYMLREADVEKQHQLAGTMTTFSKSRKTWDPANGAQLTDELWRDADDTHRAITRYDYDPLTGNRWAIWKPEQWAANPNLITNANKTSLIYDSRKLLVATEANEKGHIRNFVYEYGTGTKLETLGPNAPACAPNCGAGQPTREDHRIRVDGLGRLIERFETFGSPGSTSYQSFKVESNSYVDGPAASVTHKSAIDNDVNLSVRYTQDETQLDGHGRPIRKTVFVFGSAPANQITTFVYTGQGTLSEVKVPDPTANSSAVVSYTYTHDSLGRPLTIRRPDADRSGVDISYNGNTTTTTEFLGTGTGIPSVTKTAKDSFGRLVRVQEQLTTAPTWATTLYNYDPDDTVNYVTDPEGVTTSLVQDWAGHRTRIERAGRTWIYTYDKNGNERTETSPCIGLGCEAMYTTTTAYDVLDRPSSRTVAPRGLSNADRALFGDSETFTYDTGDNGKGRLAQWQSLSPSPGVAISTISPKWNAQGQLENNDQQFAGAGLASPLTRNVIQRHYISGELSATYYRDVVGTTNCTDGSYSQIFYDARGLPHYAQLNQCLNAPGAGLYSYVLSDRNVAGLVTKRYSQPGQGPFTYVQSRWSYDQLGRVTSQVVEEGSHLDQVVRQDLAYNGNDDPKALDHWLGATNHKHFTFTFDKRHQLTNVGETQLPNAFTATYDYHPSGRFKTAIETAATLPGSDVKPRNVTYQYAGVDPEQVTALMSGTTPFAVYAYDLAGNQSKRTYSGTGESWDYFYDGKNQLRRVARKLNGNVTGSEEYWYDQDGARQVVVKRDGGGARTDLIWFIGDTEAHYSTGSNPTLTYAHVTMGTPVARLERNSDAAAIAEYQFHGLGNNTLATVDQSTGEINASFTYAPFGELIETTNGVGGRGVETHRRRMNDKFVDEISALGYYGYRYYDRTSMTWTQSDPLYRFLPELLVDTPRRTSLYTAHLNNPLKFIDPDGRDVFNDITKPAFTMWNLTPAAASLRPVDPKQHVGPAKQDAIGEAAAAGLKALAVAAATEVLADLAASELLPEINLASDETANGALSGTGDSAEGGFGGGGAGDGGSGGGGGGGGGGGFHEDPSARAGHNDVAGPAQEIRGATRTGETRVTVKYPDGSSKDMTKMRVKERVPSPNSPTGDRNVRFKRGVQQSPGKPTKRNPTQDERDTIDHHETTKPIH